MLLITALTKLKPMGRPHFDETTKAYIKMLLITAP